MCCADAPAFQLRNLVDVETGQEAERAGLSSDPDGDDPPRRAVAHHPPQRIYSHRSGEKDRRKMSQHGEIEKEEKADHLSGGIFGQCQLKHVSRSHHEAQQQWVLADFGRQLNEHRKQAYQNEANPAHRRAQKPGQPAEEYPAENRAGNHRRQAKKQLRGSQASPHMQQQNQQWRMSQSSDSTGTPPPAMVCWRPESAWPRRD